MIVPELIAEALIDIVLLVKEVTRPYVSTVITGITEVLPYTPGFTDDVGNCSRLNVPRMPVVFTTTSCVDTLVILPNASIVIVDVVFALPYVPGITVVVGSCDMFKVPDVIADVLIVMGVVVIEVIRPY